MQEINLRVTIDDANLLLEALGNLPFARVYGLVAKLQSQASEQLARQAPATETAVPSPAPARPEEESHAA